MGAAVMTTVAPAAAAAPDVASDFNGDGFSDLVLDAPAEVLNGTVSSGGLSILFGGPSGVSGAGSQWFSPLTASLAPAGSGSERSFGGAFASGDFDGDGYDDLAVASEIDSGDTWFTGIVRVLYGSSSGLGLERDQVFREGIGGVPGDVDDDDFGTALVAGRFADSGVDDLAIGRVGGVTVLRGSASGLTAEGALDLTPGSGGVPADANPVLWGPTIAAADVDGSGRQALLVSRSAAAQLDVVPGSADGLQPESTTTVDGSAIEAQPGRIIAIATGEFGHGGEQDVAVTTRGSGGDAVVALYGSASGLTTADATVFPASLVPGQDAYGASTFGAALVAGDLGYSTYDDLAVGSFQTAIASHPQAGVVLVLVGSATGLTTAHRAVWSQNSPGISGAAETNDWFGRALQIGQYGGTSKADLGVAAPYEGVDGIFRAGGVHTIYGGGLGLTASGDVFWTQNSSGVHGAVERADEVGLPFFAYDDSAMH